jgi:hypothetical protein
MLEYAEIHFDLRVVVTLPNGLQPNWQVPNGRIQRLQLIGRSVQQPAQFRQDVTYGVGAVPHIRSVLVCQRVERQRDARQLT